MVFCCCIVVDVNTVPVLVGVGVGGCWCWCPEWMEKKKESKPAIKLASQMGGRASFFLTIQFKIQLCSIQLRNPPVEEGY